MAKWKRVRASELRSPQAQATASTGFTLSANGASSRVDIMDLVPVQRVRFDVRSQVNSIAADASEGFGIKIGVLPETELAIVASKLTIQLTAPSGLGSTAGEIGVGTVIGSGAVSVLSGTATFEDIVTGQTMTNLTKAGADTNDEYHTVAGVTIVDATAGSVAAHLNIASVWDQTSAENLTVVGTVDLWYIDLGDF